MHLGINIPTIQNTLQRIQLSDLHLAGEKF